MCNTAQSVYLRSTESIGSSSAATHSESPPGGEAALRSPAATRRMMPPQEKLAYFESRAQAMADSQQVYTYID